MKKSELLEQLNKIEGDHRIIVMVDGDDLCTDFQLEAKEIQSITDDDIYIHGDERICDLDEAIDLYCDFRNEDDYTGMENDDYYEEFDKLTEEEQDKLLSNHFDKEHVVMIKLCN